jgi:hypothetical protein
VEKIYSFVQSHVLFHFITKNEIDIRAKFLAIFQKPVAVGSKITMRVILTTQHNWIPAVAQHRHGNRLSSPHPSCTKAKEHKYLGDTTLFSEII